MIAFARASDSYRLGLYALIKTRKVSDRTPLKTRDREPFPKPRKGKLSLS